jgi:microcystin-dependent protein
MGTPYVGEIRMMANNFAPYGWAVCNGQVISIAENETLYALIGTTYGGNGQTTFALPDLRSRVPVHVGTLTGNTYVLGQVGGVEQVTLTAQQTALHNHQVNATASGQKPAPSAQAFPAAATPAESYVYGPTGNNPVSMNGGIIVSGGGTNQPHENRQPYLAINFYIALYGAYPSQN